MRQPLLALRVPIILTLSVAFIAADADAAVDIEFRDVSIDDYSYPPGDLLQIEFDVVNVGDTRSGIFYVRAFASSDTVITDDDYHLDTDSVHYLDPGSNSRGRMLYAQFPSSIPPGDYYIGMISYSPDDVNPDNDTYYISTTVSIDDSYRPDLTFRSINVENSSSRFLPGDQIRVDLVVENIGVQKSGEYGVVCYASEDSSITEDDHRLFGRSGLGSREPGETGGPTFWGPFPDIPAGEYYIGGIISCPMEHNTDNNSDYGDKVTLLAHGPNLVVSWVDYASNVADRIVQPGDTIDVEIAVENTGIGRANSYVVNYYTCGNGPDRHMGSANGDSIEPGGQQTFVTTCTLPDDIPDGDYNIWVTIEWSYDSGSGATEGSGDAIVRIGSPIDLAVQSVRVTSGAYAPGDNLIVTNHIKNISERDSESYAVNYYASTDTTISEDDHRIGRVERDALQSGQEDTFETTCRIPFSVTAGRYYIGIIITSQNEFGRANNVGHATATVQVVSPSRYVYGRAEYQYSENPTRTFPIRCALVQAFEADNNNDPLDDHLLAQTHTDPNGDYALALPKDRSSDRDIYIKILTEGAPGAWPGTTSKIGMVKDEVFEEIYSVVSEVYPHPGDDSVVINVRTPGNGEFIVFDSVVEGFIKAKAFFDVELDPATVFWPSEAGFSYYDPCDSRIYIEQFDARDRDVIMHEYGHVLAEVCGVAQGPVGEDGRHYWNRDLRDYPVARTNQHAMNLAFREGWATLFSIATQYGNNDVGYPGAGDSNYDDGEGGPTIKVDLDNIGEERYSPGKYFENMVAGALWDIFDDKNDEPDGKDTLSDPSLTMTWTISQDYKPRDMQDFWNNWFKKYEYKEQMKYIFNTHNMWFAVPE